VNAQQLDRIRFVTQNFQQLQGLRCLVPAGLILLSQGVAGFFPSWPLVFLQMVLSAGAVFMMFGLKGYYQSTFGEVESRRIDAGLYPLSIYSPAGAAPLAPERRPVPVKPFLQILLPMLVLLWILRMILPSAIIMTDGSGVSPWGQLHPPVVEVLATASMPRSSSDLNPFFGQWMYAVCGALFLTVWFSRGRRLSQSYYLVLGAPLLGLGALGSCLGLVLPALWAWGGLKIPSVILLALAHLWMAQILCGGATVIAGLLDHWQLARVLKPVREEQP
jgi:hypothetical protein